MSFHGGLFNRKLLDDRTRSPYAIDEFGTIVRVGQETRTYRCAMYKCQQPVHFTDGQFRHAIGQSCTEDEAYHMGIIHTERPRWYSIACSVCEHGVLPISVSLTNIPLTARRMPPRRRTGDYSKAIHELMAYCEG